MNKSIFKKGTSALLAMVMCLSTFLGIGSTTAFAAENTTDEVVMISFPRDGDDNLGGNWGHEELHYMNGWTASETNKITVYTVGSWTGNACYCIEPGTPLSTGDNLTKRDETYWDNYPSTYNSTISADEIKLFIGRIFQYGYTETVTTSWRSQNADDADKMAHIMATQTLIWETVVGERDSDFNHVDTGSYDAISDRVSISHPLYSRYISYYNSIASNVQKHSKVPSFCAKSTSKAQNIELEWNGTNYTATLTDTNNVLSQYTFTASESGINFSVSGNKLTITAEKAPASAVSITATKNGSVRKGVVVWSDGVITPGSGIQDLTTFTAEVNDPVKGYLNIKVSVGSAKIVKTSEDGKIDGITFTITGNGIDKTVTTNAKGEVQIDNLTPGVYTVTEQNYDKYEPQEVRRVTVVSGQVTTVSFNNVLKRGDLVVTKTSEDGLNEGVKFHLYGTSFSGLAVDEYAVTDSSGKAYFNDVLIGTDYTLEEVDTAIRYVIPEKQTATVEWNEVTNKSFTNILKKWNVTVTKSDKETGAAQGNASLAGATYGIYKGDQLIDTYTTDENGQFTTDYYVCGDDWSVREIEPSEGYLLDSSAYHIGAEAKNYTVEYNSSANDEQKDYLAELLKDENNSLWAAVLYGINYSDDQIVTVALSQIGNVGGTPYWSWYGFGSRVEWCACFVSWCANECGYIDTGVIPKYAGCVNGVEWFKSRGQWADGSSEPVAGMIIFFDWDNKGSSGPQDGQSDHTGVVQKVENGIVYTVEGNSSDSVRVNQYPIGHYEILGYGIPQY